MSDKTSKENCTADYPAIWRFTFSYLQRVGHSVWGTGEVETIGHQRASGQFDVMAVNEEFARAAYNEEYGWKEQHGYDEHKLISGPEFICYVDYIVKSGRGWQP